VSAALAPDVEWVEGDIEGLPYRGVDRGPEAVGRDVFAQIPGAHESFELVPQGWVDGGDPIVTGGPRFQPKRGPGLEVQDGRITRFECFQDALATASVLGAVG
jgi:ketosteroid isomerase-like protein